MENKVSPTAGKERLIWIDMARGFAILGIFIVNIGAFSAPYFLHGGADEAWDGLTDRTAQAVIDIFFQASFYTLFSILFGFGMQLMAERLPAKGLSVYPFMFRRLVVLLGLGAVHAFGLWHGDILLSYGAVGIVAMVFLRARAGVVLGAASVLLIGTVSLFTLLLYSMRDIMVDGSGSRPAVQQALENYQNDSITAIWAQNFRDWMYGNGSMSGLFFLLVVILPLFLFGMYLAKKRWLHDPERFQPILRRLWSVSMFVFIAVKAGPYLFGNPLWLSFFQDNIGGPASAMFYLLSITMLARQKKWQTPLLPFSYVGRMALTNYLLQSVISFVLFYGVGFGFYGHVGPALGMAIAISLFGLQILGSRWWLQRYRFGPVEWIWRSLTYGERQPFRRGINGEGV